MGEDLYLILFKKKKEQEIMSILKCNEITRQYGLELTDEEINELVKRRYELLRAIKRRDFGNWVIDKIIKEFCSSEFINKGNYVKSINEIMYLFYYCKNNTKNKVEDAVLLKFMRKHFNGSFEQLRDNVLDKMIENVLEDRPMNYGIKEKEIEK